MPPLVPAAESVKGQLPGIPCECWGLLEMVPSWWDVGLPPTWPLGGAVRAGLQGKKEHLSTGTWEQ